MYKAYLFDFDGTLVDSMPTFESVMLRILNENNVEYEKDIIKTLTPLGALGIAKHFTENMGMNRRIDEILGFIGEYMYYEYKNTIPAKEGVIEAVKKLKESGASLNILTASPHLTLDACVERLGIADLFDNIWSCDDFGTTKTNPDIYLKAAEKIGFDAKDVLFVDDNCNADKTAKEAGMPVCGIYDDSSAEYEDEMKEICDYYVYNFAEILDI